MDGAHDKPAGERPDDTGPKAPGQRDTPGRDTSEETRDLTEEERARLDRDAGDVADDLADFA